MDWIKLMCNILDNRKIKMVRKGPEGDTLVLLWLLILVEAGKCNRGGYLMVSDTLPYTAETLSMVTDIPLPTVQLGLITFAGLDMIDQQDNAIYIKNWRKYQSADKLEAQREKARVRQQRHRQKERENLPALHAPERMSRDSHGVTSRDVTPESREEKNRVEKTTTTAVAVDHILERLPRELQLDSEVRGWVSDSLATHGEDYTASNISATVAQAKSNQKAFLRRALREDWGHLYRAKQLAAEEKTLQAAQIGKQEKQKEEAEALKIQKARVVFGTLSKSDQEKILTEARRNIYPTTIPQMIDAKALEIVLNNYMPAGQVTESL